MWSEILKVVLTSLGALAVAWSVFTFKEGGRRRMLRREIVEELELIQLLDERPDAASLIQTHVDELLHKYVSPTRPTWRRKATMFAVRVGLSVGMAAAVVYAGFPWWGLLAMVVIVGLAGAAAEVWLERRWERQDVEIDRATHGALAD